MNTSSSGRGIVVRAARLIACAALVSLELIAAAPAAMAQAFPSKAIKIIVPFPAGGTTDIAARLVAQKMSESMGQPVTVENRGGAGGSLGADAVAKAPADGYTILMHNITFPLASISLALAGRAPYNIDTDFAAISNVVNVPLVITAHPSVPVRDLRELTNMLSSSRSLQYNYGSTGPGSFMNVVGEALKRDAKFEMTQIPFKGAAPLKLELMSGRVQIGGDQVSSSLAEIRSGKLKALATNATKRIPALPDVPTVRELGFPIIEANGWNGLFAPAKTPREVIDRLQKEVASAVRQPDIVKRFTDIAAEPSGSTSAELDAMLKGQVAQFRPILSELKPNVE